MGTEKYISEVKLIAAPQLAVYDRLSNFKNLEQLFDPTRIEELKKQNPDVPDMKLDNFQATADDCSFSISPIGKVSIHITEREPLKLIKLSSGPSVPFQFHCWIQLIPIDEISCKVRITIHAELNMMFKMIVHKHLKTGVDQIANALTKIPYN
jgi:hypothetical protein